MARKIARINGIALDIVVSETPDYSSEITSYPVEDGEDISDHVHNLPVGVSIEAVINAIPFGLASERGDDPLVEVRAALTELRAKRQPFKYEGLFHVYESMIFESISFPRDASTGNSLRISATMRRVNTVELVRVASRLRPSPKSGGKPIWLCPPLTAFAGATASNGIGITNPGTATTTKIDPIKPTNSAAANQRRGCRRVVRRNGVWVFADNGQRLTLDQINETNRQNSHANIIAVTGAAVVNKETIQVGIPISSLPTYNPGLPAIEKLSRPPLPSHPLTQSFTGPLAPPPIDGRLRR